MGGFLRIIIDVLEVIFGGRGEPSGEQAPPRKRSRSQLESEKKKFQRRSFSHEFIAPQEKDLKPRTFSVVNPEGEVFRINTADTSSYFYGPVWTRILDAYTTGDFVRGRVSNRMTGKDGRFAGYCVSIDGVEVFLPASKGGVFRNEEKDATSRCIALKIQDVFTNGVRSGTVIVDAKEPYKVVENELRRVDNGEVFHALAMDVDGDHLIFPSPGYGEIRVPLDQARTVMRQAGGDLDDYFMTGLYWELLMTQKGSSNHMARARRVLV